MVKKELSEIEISESIADMWNPLSKEQREYLVNHFTIQKYKK
ncbi:MAG: Crp/Fnr family transcriptional regulator, partial [Bacteroides sp.]